MTIESSASRPDPVPAAAARYDLAGFPPPPRRPVQWRRLRRELAILQRGDPREVVDAAYAVGDAIGGMSEERMLARLLESETGRVLARAQPSLPAALDDHAALRALSADSLGRAYVRFCERHGIRAHALVEAQRRMSRDYERLDPLRRWWRDRFTVIHDLSHVLAGYDATDAGESALMCFFLAQRVNDRALPLFIPMSLASRRLDPANALVAIRRGHRAARVCVQHFEALLAEPLASVRRGLGIDEPRLAHARPAHAGMLVPTD